MHRDFYKSEPQLVQNSEADRTYPASQCGFHRYAHGSTLFVSRGLDGVIRAAGPRDGHRLRRAGLSCANLSKSRVAKRQRRALSLPGAQPQVSGAMHRGLKARPMDGRDAGRRHRSACGMVRAFGPPGVRDDRTWAKPQAGMAPRRWRWRSARIWLPWSSRELTVSTVRTFLPQET